jgi:hydrogenase expression/formation protein HypD
MKYVDEFRDHAKAQFLVEEIQSLVRTMNLNIERPVQIMEVCGGHTHSIFRYGIEGMLPKEIELVHGPGCPVCVLPMGRVDDCVAIAERPDVIFTTFGDSMRVPGSKKKLAAGESRRRRCAHGLFADGRFGAFTEESWPGGRLFRDRLRDDNAIDRADDPEGGARRY